MTLIIPEWAVWLLAAVLLVNAIGVGIDTVVRKRVNKALLENHHRSEA